jgi:hypothetical protein
MQLKKNIATSESGFIFNPSTGDSFSANPLAAQIILLLKDGNSIADIKKTILEQYEVSESMLEKDWDDFISQLHAANLLQS